MSVLHSLAQSSLSCFFYTSVIIDHEDQEDLRRCGGVVSDIAPDMAHCVPREFCQDLRRCGGIERCIERCHNLLQRFHSSNLHQFHTHLHSLTQSSLCSLSHISVIIHHEDQEDLRRSGYVLNNIPPGIRVSVSRELCKDLGRC